MSYLKLIVLIFIFPLLAHTQTPPVNCELSVPGCTTPEFPISGSNPTVDYEDFTTGGTSNPTSNPQGINAGCLLSGETVSTFITISVSTSGTLEWSLIGINGAGNPTGSGCFDWIMWQNEDGDACDDIHNDVLGPVACNWNGTCNGNTGMANAANYPPNASSSSYQPPINVVAGEQYILCLSNYSFTSQNVNLDFFGSATVTCDPSTPDQDICLGSVATVDVLSFGLTNPVYNWLVTTGVSNPTGGTDVLITVSDTTEYVVEITADEGVFYDTFMINVIPPPTPNAGLNDTVCFGEAIVLNGTQDDVSNTIVWNVNTGTISPTPYVNFNPNASAIDPVVTVNQPGVYHFILSEDNGICPAVNDTVDILVSKTTQTTTFTEPSCGGMTDGTITINNSDAVSYSFDNGATWVTNDTQGGFGVGTYTLFSQNQHGCMTSSNTTVTEPDQLSISAGNDTLICQNGSANLWADISVSGLTVDYHWSHTSNLSENVVVGPYTSDQTISVYAVGPSGCTSDTTTIQVNVRPVLSGNISPFDTICPGYPTNISVFGISGGLNPYDVLWSTGETANDVTQMEIEVNPPQTQTYTVTITDVCETTPLVLNTQVYVAPLPEPKMSVVDSILCEPASFEIHYETDPTMTAGYVWYFPFDNSAINEPVIFTDSLPEGTYDVQLIVTSPLGCIDSVTNIDFLTSQSKPTANFTWSPNPILMFNTEVHFQNLSTLDYLYDWSIPGAIPPSSMQERPKVTYPNGEIGTYPVTLIVTSELGCKDTITKNVIVHPEVSIYVPNTFTPDNDEYNQNWEIVIHGIDDFSFHLQVFNRWGEMVFESHDKTVGWDGTYNGKLVKSGTYSWKISCRDFHNDDKYEWTGFVNVLK